MADFQAGSAGLSASGRVGPTTFGALFGLRSTKPAAKENQASQQGTKGQDFYWPLLPYAAHMNWSGGGFPDDDDSYNSYVSLVGMVHSGQDFNGRAGGSTDFGHPIYIIADGVVEAVGTGLVGWGKIVLIRHALLGIWSMYAHMHKVQSAMRVGEPVHAGQLLGTVGDGDGAWVGKAHLHFEIRKTALPIGNTYLPKTRNPKSATALKMRQTVLQNYINPRLFLTARGAKKIAPKG